MKSELDKFLVPQECSTLVRSVKEHGTRRDYILILTAMNVATRVGELVRLRPEDFRPIEGVVNCPTLKRLSPSEKALKRVEKKAGRLWCKRPIRAGELPDLYLPVPLPQPIFEEIDRYIKDARLERWLFPGRRGLHISERQAERVFDRWSEASGISPNVSIHALRHSRGVDLYEKGVELLAIRDFLRHENLSSTSVYQHLSPARRKVMIEMMGTLGIPQGTPDVGQ